MVGFLFFFCLVVLSQAATLIRFAEADSFAICFWRLLFATIMLLPFVLNARSHRNLKSLVPGDWLHLVLSGAFLFAHFYMFFRSVQETTVANSTILFSINPVTTAIAAYLLFRERVSWHLALACLLGIAGVATLFSESLTTHVSDFQGDVWGVLSAIAFSGYIVTGKHVRTKLPNSLYAAAIYLQTAIYAAISMLLRDVPFFSYSDKTWWAFLALAILPTLLGHAVFTYCLNFMNVNFMSCMTLIEPLLAALTAAWLFGEPLTKLAAVGFALTCAAVFVLYWETLRTLIRRVIWFKLPHPAEPK